MNKIKTNKDNLIKKKKIFKWQNFLWLTVAGIINSIGVTLFLAPLHLYDSGLSGTALLLSQLTPISLSIFLIVLNLPFFIFGFKKQGLAFTVYSIYAITIYSVSAYLIQNVIPIDLSKSPIAGNDILLCAIFGGMVSGIGSGLTIRFGGAIDGVEVMAVIFAKYIGMTIGTFVMAYNAILYIAAGAIFSNWTLPLYSIVTYAIGVKTVDYVVDGFDKAKAAIIITSKGDEISQKISASLGRSITVIDAKGYYSGNKKNMLYCVVNRFQIGRLKKIIMDIDTAAFVTVSDISDTLGTSLKLAKRKKQRIVSDTPTDSVIEQILLENLEKIEVIKSECDNEINIDDFVVEESCMNEREDEL